MEVIVFDLDDTLYFEKSYVISGFRSVSKYIGERTGISYDLLFIEMFEAFEKGTRTKIFDLLLSRHPEINCLFSVEDLVKHYRFHDPSIALIPEAEEMIRLLGTKNRNLGIISDGFLETQTRKIQSLKLSTRINTIILTDIWGKDFWKPHTRAFEEMELIHRAQGERFVYVGDNPSKDFIPAKERGWNTVRLRLPGQLHFLEEPLGPEYQPELQCSSFEELTEILFSQS